MEGEQITDQLAVYVYLKKSGAGSREVVQLVDNLVSELQKVEGVRLFADAGDKLGAADFFGFLAKLADTKVIESFVKAIGSWLTRDRTCTLKLQIGANSIEAAGLTREEQRDLIRWFKVQAGLPSDNRLFDKQNTESGS